MKLSLLHLGEMNQSLKASFQTVQLQSDHRTGLPDQFGKSAAGITRTDASSPVLCCAKKE